MPSTVEQDFDRIALVSEDGATHNDHYHNFLLRHLPARIDRALEIGCGTGTFARLLAQRADHVVALDVSSEMIRLARERSTACPNIDFQLADVLKHPLESFIRLPPESSRAAQRHESVKTAHEPLEPSLPTPRSAESPGDAHGSDGLSSGAHMPPDSFSAAPPVDSGFDCIATIATLHHLAMEQMLIRMKSALNPGGVLLILDLYQPTGLLDQLLNLLAIPVSVGLRLIHHHRLLPRREERDAWTAHAHHDIYPTMTDVHTLCARLLPGAKIHQHLLWRYSIVWKKAY